MRQLIICYHICSVEQITPVMYWNKMEWNGCAFDNRIKSAIDASTLLIWFHFLILWSVFLFILFACSYHKAFNLNKAIGPPFFPFTRDYVIWFEIIIIDHETHGTNLTKPKMWPTTLNYKSWHFLQIMTFLENMFKITAPILFFLAYHSTGNTCTNFNW